MYKNLIILLIIIYAAGCKKPYAPAAVMQDHNFLVVEGVINAKSNSITSITLSRTRKLSDTTLIIPETNAKVFIEDNSGTTYSLPHIGNGIYKSNSLTLNVSRQYRLKISTGNSEEFLSDFVPVKLTPVIDSLTWKYDNDVTIYVNSHDPQKNTRFYRWDFVETWEYHPFYDSQLGYANGKVYFRDSSNMINKCWSEKNSTDILIRSTLKLSEDVISQVPIAIVPRAHEKLAVKYSILVKQYGLSGEAFDYWQMLKKNTEELGSLFDAQPSQLTGNIHNVKNPGQPVIGYISACIVEEKRIFIKRSEVDNWFGPTYNPEAACPPIVINPSQASLYLEGNPSLAPAYFTVMGGLVISQTICVDCRSKERIPIKPPFWQ